MCFAESGQQLLVGVVGNKRAGDEQEEAKLQRDFDAAIRAGALRERDQMLAAIQHPKLICMRTEVRLLDLYVRF